MTTDELPDDLVAFLKLGRRLEFDASTCEIGDFTLRSLNEIEAIEMAVGAEDGESACVIRGLDLMKWCEEYDSRGMLVYIPALRKYGSYDGEKKSLITYREMSWSAFCADPAKYLNAGWFVDEAIAEETFTESDTDRVVEVCSAASSAEAGFLCTALEQKGIRAEVVGENAAGGLPLGATTAPRIWTREGDAGRAREIIAECRLRQRKPVGFAGHAERAAAENEDIMLRCQDCGITLTFPAASRGYVESCPACGAYVDVPSGRGGALPGEAVPVEAILIDDVPGEVPPAGPPPAAEKPAPAEASPPDSLTSSQL